MGDTQGRKGELSQNPVTPPMRSRQRGNLHCLEYCGISTRFSNNVSLEFAKPLIASAVILRTQPVQRRCQSHIQVGAKWEATYQVSLEGHYSTFRPLCVHHRHLLAQQTTVPAVFNQRFSPERPSSRVKLTRPSDPIWRKSKLAALNE